MARSLQMVKEAPLLGFAWDLWEKRSLLWQMTKRDFQNRYAGSTLGMFWAFAQPIFMMAILYFVFTFGLKAGPTRKDIPFAAWFFPAMIAWNYFSEAVLVSSNVLSEYSFLVKKVRFRVAILPIVKVLASTMLHLIFLLIVGAVLAFNGIFPELFWLQVFYFVFSAFVLLVGLSWIFSALNIFLKDVGQMIGIILQFGFWVTPVIWDSTSIPDKFQIFMKLNPMYYIVEGYRATFLYHIPFWNMGLFLNLYFWAFTLATLAAGMLVFRKLRPHFADVL